MTDHATLTQAGSGPHHLMIGSVVVSKLLGAAETGGQLSLVELEGLPGSGPGAHLDAWRETFYVLAGQITFEVERDGTVEQLVAGPGDVVTIPAGVGHAFHVTSAEPARYLIASTAAGLDEFFADAGEELREPLLPSEPQPFDRERLRAAFAKWDQPHYEFPVAQMEARG